MSASSLPARDDQAGALSDPPLSYETLRPLGHFPVIAFGVAYELELAGVVRLLLSAGLPLFSVERDERHPLVLAGGPLTYANPRPLAPFVDAIVLGEAEGTLEPVLERLRRGGKRDRVLEELGQLPHVWVPRTTTLLPPLARAPDWRLPARSVIRTSHTELADMFLVEAERGCSRSCSYCVMRRERSGGMRLVPSEQVLEAVPPDARRVGLVGAAVSDHPELPRLLEALASRGSEVGVSSLRPDRLTPELVALLARTRIRTLTTALDGASERLRTLLNRSIPDEQLVEVARLAGQQQLERLKLYLMLGLPRETESDLDQCVRLLKELSRRIRVTLAVSFFCAKAGTPLAGEPFAGLGLLKQRLERLRRGLRGRVELRATSARWAWVEHVLATGAEAEGRAVAQAVLAGGRFSDFRTALGRLGHSPLGPGASARSPRPHP